MATSILFPIPEHSQELLIQLHRRHYELMHQQYNLREAMRLVDLAYMREEDMTETQWRAKIANKIGDADKIQNITVPIIKPQINAAVAYQAAVFLSQYPIFEISADPRNQDVAAQFQALLEENSVRGGWVREIILHFYDAFKYNLSALECSWCTEKSPALETDLTYKEGKEGKPTEVIWSGNVIKRWDMYNTYWDVKCDLADMPEFGEFCGHTVIRTRTALIKLLQSIENALPGNDKKALESATTINIPVAGSGVTGFYVPFLNPDILIDYSLLDKDNWDAWVGLDSLRNKRGINYKNVYELSVEYNRIIPEEYGLRVPAADQPQIWKFHIVNHSVIIAAERQTNAHNKIPVFFSSPLEDGLGYQTKSLAVDSKPFQQVASAIMNGIMAGRRRSVADRILYDPSRVSEKHINNPSPTAKMPVRPSAYGRPVSEAVYQFPYREDQAAQGFQEISTIVQLSNVLNGQNQARQGQFVKGNKTDSQWEATMSNATSADQLSAQKLEVQTFTPLKEILKLNYMQYQGGTELYSDYQQKTVKIDPVVLRKAVIKFKVTDGLNPKEKVMSSEARKVAMQVIGSSQVLAGGYNIAPLFSYIMKLENVDLTPFEKSQQQQVYEQAVAQWSQLAQMAIQKGSPFNVPQPTPQQFGFDPNAMDPSKQVTNSEQS